MPIRMLVAMSGLALIVTGCGRTEKLDLGSERLPQLLQLDREIPIIYDTRHCRVPLHSRQYEAVVDYARGHGPKGQDPWFILVAHNYRPKGKEYGADFRSGSVHVFFTPRVRLPRLRRGQRMFLSVHGTKILNYTEWMTKAKTSPYCQVSMPKAPFTADLRLPPKPLWPFYASASLSDAQVVEAADLTRHVQRTGGPFKGMPIKIQGAGHLVEPLSFMEPPIYSIRQKGDGAIEVLTGTQQAPEAAFGAVLEFERQAGEWVLHGLGVWRS